MSRAGSIASRSRSARGFHAMRMGGFQKKESVYSRPCVPQEAVNRCTPIEGFPECGSGQWAVGCAARARGKGGQQVRGHLAEGRAVVDGGGLGHQTDAGGILGNLRDTEPRGGVAAGLLVGRRPHREGEKNPEADHLSPDPTRHKFALHNIRSLPDALPHPQPISIPCLGLIYNSPLLRGCDCSC